MTISEMHIAIDQKLQNMNSYVFENFRPEEIDLFINEMQEAFIKQRMYPESNPKKRGFEDSQKRLADLQTIVREAVLYPIVDNTNPDYRKYYITDGTPALVTNTVAGTLYQIATVGNTDFTAIGAARNEAGTVFTASAAGTGTGTVLTYDFFMFVSGRVNLIVNTKALSLSAGVTPRYLGMAGTSYNPASPAPQNGDFYIASQTGTYGSFGGITAVKGSILYYTTGWSVKTLPVFNFPKYGVPIRLVEHEEADRISQNPFAKSTERSPVATLRGNTLVMPVSERFILKDVSMVYLRKPRAVSLSSSYNCELPDHTHSEIVDLVVSHILEVIESRRYQSQSLEALKNE